MQDRQQDHQRYITWSSSHLVGVLIGEGVFAAELLAGAGHIHLDRWPCCLRGEEVHLRLCFLGCLGLIWFCEDGLFYIYLGHCERVMFKPKNEIMQHPHGLPNEYDI